MIMIIISNVIIINVINVIIIYVRYKNLHSSSDSPHNYYLHFSFRENKVNMNAFKEGK